MLLGSAFTDILPATFILIGFTVVGGIIIFAIRRVMKSDFKGSSTFTLGELKELRDKGEINDVEFQRAKDSIIDHMK